MSKSRIISKSKTEEYYEAVEDYKRGLHVCKIMIELHTLDPKAVDLGDVLKVAVKLEEYVDIIRKIWILSEESGA